MNILRQAGVYVRDRFAGLIQETDEGYPLMLAHRKQLQMNSCFTGKCILRIPVVLFQAK